MDSDDLKTKAKELWELIVKLETERYDLEERARRQDYEVKRKNKLIRFTAQYFS